MQDNHCWRNPGLTSMSLSPDESRGLQVEMKINQYTNCQAGIYEAMHVHLYIVHVLINN